MLGFDNKIGKNIKSNKHLDQSIRDILTTPIGTRVMRREYGSRLPDLVDRPYNAELALELKAATAEALDRWEPRFELEQVTTYQSEAGKVMIDVVGRYRVNGESVRISSIGFYP